MGLSSSLQKKITGQKWYHQRFDGAPMFLYFIAEAELKQEDRKPAGTEATIRVSFFSEGKGDWYIDMNDIMRGAQVLVEQAKNDPSVSTILLAAWKDDEDKFTHFFWEEFPQITLSELSNTALLELWNRFRTLAINRLTSSSVIDHFALGTDQIVCDMIREQIGEVEKESDFTEVFSIATAPVHHSFINKAEIDLLKIATKQSQETVEEYQRRYFWIRNNYVLAQEQSVDYFKAEIEAWKKSGKDLVKELVKIENATIENAKAKEKLFSKYNFSDHLRTLLKISEDFTWWQDMRKKSTYFYVHIGCKILSEVSKRIGYDLENLKYAISPELEGILNSQAITEKVLMQRRKGCVYVCTPQETYFVAGKEVEEIRKTILGEENIDNVQDIRGLSASRGKAIGRAKVLTSSTQINKMEYGDILVAVMTRPDYVPAMKKAAAIVTDEGGITSHAAIVSRELGIPCIIGTKIATQVFQDGQLIEVNANHGWARKVQQY